MSGRGTGPDYNPKRPWLGASHDVEIKPGVVAVGTNGDHGYKTGPSEWVGGGGGGNAGGRGAACTDPACPMCRPTLGSSGGGRTPDADKTVPIIWEGGGGAALGAAGGNGTRQSETEITVRWPSGVSLSIHTREPMTRERWESLYLQIWPEPR